MMQIESFWQKILLCTRILFIIYTVIAMLVFTVYLLKGNELEILSQIIIDVFNIIISGCNHR